MSILEKIVKTENEVQTNIEKAHKNALKLISDARESSFNEAEKIRLETNETIVKINNNLETKKTNINERLKTDLNTQIEEVLKLVESKTKAVIDAMFKEAIK